jgi:hypothetical protein
MCRRWPFQSRPSISLPATHTYINVECAWMQIRMVCWQGDQIGRIFYFWATVTLGSFLKITEMDQIIGLLISTVKETYVLILTKKNELGYILGDFFQKRIWSPCVLASSWMAEVLHSKHIFKLCKLNSVTIYFKFHSECSFSKSSGAWTLKNYFKNWPTRS